MMVKKEINIGATNLNISCDKNCNGGSSVVTGKFDHFTFNVHQPSKERENVKTHKKDQAIKDYICGYREI